MSISFIELSDQIDLNEKRLEALYARYELYNTRFGTVTILYSVMAIYLIQVLKFCFSNDNPCTVIYSLIFFVFLCLLIYSIYNSFKLLAPKNVAFQELPTQFYKTLANQYRESGMPEEEIDEYIKASYNTQLEEILQVIDDLCLDKGERFSNAFNFACISIIPYLICVAIYLFCPKNEAQDIKLNNYKQIIQYIDSNKIKNSVGKSIVIIQKKDSTKKVDSLSKK